MKRRIHLFPSAPFFLALVFLAQILPDLSAQAQQLPGADIFDAKEIVRISITIPEAGMRTLRNYHFQGGGEGEKPEARATVTDGERTYKDVSVQLKGAAGSFRPIDRDPALTLKFNKHVKGQTFHGLEKISLNNSRQDHTYIHEKISRELFAKAGIPVPRSDYAVVTLNGRNLGFYVLVEGFNKQFLRRYFKRTDGNLYDGGFCQEITNIPLNVNSGEHPEDQSDLAELAEAASAARQSNSLKDLGKVLDVDRFITMIATEILLCHWDGYAMNRNNYRVFSDKESGKMIFMPHGMDQMFGIGGMGSPHTPIFPQMNGMVARAVVGTTEGRSRYRMKVAELRTNLFNVAEITKRVREIEARIQPVIAQVRPSHVSAHKSMVNTLCQNIQTRADNLDQQLSGPLREVRFTKSGVLQLDGWKARQSTGNARFDSVVGPDGTSLLQITADSGRSAASWRTRVVLAQGQYRLEGRARTKDAGAVLRISGSRNFEIYSGESNWVSCSHDFEVLEPIADIELICELRGSTGAVWFDASSLKLRRLH